MQARTSMPSERKPLVDTMQLHSTKAVLIFALVTTMAAVLFSHLLTYPLVPAEELRHIQRYAFLITPIVAFPICTFVGFKIKQNSELTRQMRRLLNRDRLTDVSTRDFFFARLARHPDNYGISLMVDIDHFKRVNDSYGHLTGDAVIAHVAGILAQEVRNQDLVCRFGGEEFVVFLDQSSRAAALAVAERIRQRVEATPVDSEGYRVSVTVSIGGSLEQAARED